LAGNATFAIYYNNVYPSDVIQGLGQFDIAVMGQYNMNPSIVAQIQAAGAKNVICYISIGEDTEPTHSYPGITSGPRTWNTATSSVVSTNGGYPSWYVDYYWNDTAYVADAVPDVNKYFLGYFVYPDDNWRDVLRYQRKGGSTKYPQRTLNPGLEQLLGARTSDSDTDESGNFGCDGVFLDTIDTSGPYENVYGYYPFTAIEMYKTIKFIKETYPDKLILANRGLFYYDPVAYSPKFKIRPFDYSFRQYINMALFESFYLDSDSSNPNISPYWTSNWCEYAPKLAAEAGRGAGFTVLSLDYEQGRTADKVAAARSYSLV